MPNPKKILVITPIYPGQGVPSEFTSVVHYFTREWVKMGYQVLVIHTCSYFPIIYYYAPNFVRRWIANKVGFALPEERLNTPLKYTIDGVIVYRIPMKKYIPMSRYRKSIIQKAWKQIDLAIQNEHFQPDYIVSHWANPAMDILPYIKQKYLVKTAMVLHGNAMIDVNQLSLVDVWGYRSLAIRNAFERQYGKVPHAFICKSGIPSIYTHGKVHRNWDNPYRFIYVGQLLQRKHPECVVDAVDEYIQKEGGQLKIIGKGPMQHYLIKQIQKKTYGWAIILLGKLSRDSVITELDSSDIYILISKNESFGLTCLEAMARGCIVIVSRHEGMEDIVEDGVNGFYCTAGCTEELRMVIRKIMCLSSKERAEISYNAIQTATKLTDEQVAREYIEHLTW